MKAHLPENIDTLFVNCNLATMQGNSLDIIEDGALAVTGTKISWIDKRETLSKADLLKAKKLIVCKNKWLLPGFVDCHTHLVWAGSRSQEFEKRLEGISYEEIAKQGGGIMSTVHATRKASKEELFDLAARRVDFFLKQGITTLEIKTGYGLDLKTELKMLEVIAHLDKHFPLHIEPTFLGAHTLPSEYKNNPDVYIRLVTDTMLPMVKDQGIATAVDAFCEKIAFSRDLTKIVFEKATQLGFKVKLHAEQLSDSDGASLAADFNALSCDHLEYLSESSTKKMAQKDVSAVILPGAFYYLNQTQKPPIELLRKFKIPMAVSTDLNPGSSPVHSMTQVLNMACVLFGLTCKESLQGATINGARALGLEKSKGSLTIGKDADLALWSVDTPIDLCYLSGHNRASMVMVGGKTYHDSLNK